ncbi:hypothetical protein Liucustia_112 [Acinetobacter phage Liucustia]|nr:hypothetical protein Liucustia_112 [Acinetobacter phage Liucustia]
MKILLNGLEWDSEVHKNLIKKLGGVKVIEGKIKESLLAGEAHYYKMILHVKETFEAHNVGFK